MCRKPQPFRQVLQFVNISHWISPTQEYEHSLAQSLIISFVFNFVGKPVLNLRQPYKSPLVKRQVISR